MISSVSIIDCSKITNYGLKKEFDSFSAFDLVLKKIKDSNLTENYYVLVSKENKELFSNYKTIEVDNYNLKSYFLTLKNSLNNYDALLYFNGDSPFYDITDCKKILTSHINYVADYSYPEGFPNGVVCEVVNTEILEALAFLAGENETKKEDSFFTYFEKDINSFDIFVYLSKIDLRRLRLNFFIRAKRDLFLAKKIYSKIGSNNIIEYINQNEKELMSIPSYYQFQISEKCLQSCNYCPYPKINLNCLTSSKIMSFDCFKNSLDKIEAYSDDAYISLSYLGESSTVENIYDYINEVINRKEFKLVIETSGLGWNIEELKKIDFSKISFIISLDAITENDYKLIRGNGFDEAYNFTLKMLELFPNNVYIQSIRNSSNIDSVDRLYNFFKEKTNNIIIQKPNSYAKFIDEKSVVDLSPIDRYACWHLKREIVILVDGRIPLCFCDLKNEFTCGNIFTDNLETIFAKLEDEYKKQVDSIYSPICLRCDEFWTYNF